MWKNFIAPRASFIDIGRERFYSVMLAHREMERSLAGLQYRVREGLTRSVKINDRIFIPEFEVEFDKAETIDFWEIEMDAGNNILVGRRQLWRLLKGLPEGEPTQITRIPRTIEEYLHEDWPVPQKGPHEEILVCDNYLVRAQYKPNSLRVTASTEGKIGICYLNFDQWEYYKEVQSHSENLVLERVIRSVGVTPKAGDLWRG